MHIDLTQFLNDARSMCVRRLKNILRSYHFVKVWFTFCGEFIKASPSLSEIKDFKYLSTKTRIINLDDDLNEWCNTFVRDSIISQLEEFQVSNSINYYFY